MANDTIHSQQQVWFVISITVWGKQCWNLLEWIHAKSFIESRTIAQKSSKWCLKEEPKRQVIVTRQRHTPRQQHTGRLLLLLLLLLSPSNHSWYQKTRHTGTRRWKPHTSVFPCFDTMPECDGRTDWFTVAYSVLTHCKNWLLHAVNLYTVPK